MPIITKPSPLEKSATGIFSLDKTALALHPIVVASAHFSSPNVWDKIILKYKSETLGQFESVEFDATLASPEGQFFVSDTAEDIFEVEKITIIDKDGAILLIPRADLTVAEFDIDFGSVAPELSYFLYNQLGTGHTTDAFGAISSSVSQNSQSFNTIAINGDFDVEYTFDEAIPGSAHDSIFGLKTTLDGQNNYVGFLIWNSYALVYFNAGSQGSVAMAQGQNVFRIKRTGSVIDFYHNEVKTLNSHNFSGNLYLVVRANAGFDLISTVDNLGVGSNFVPVTWNVAGKTGAGTVTTGANGLITKATGGSGYNVNVLSNETITGDGYVEFIWSHFNVVFGLAETNEPSGSYTNTVYGGYNAGEGWEITNNGGFNGSSLQNNSLVVGDVIKIERIGNLYKSFKNGLLMHTCNINNTNPMKATISIYSQTNGVNGATISL